MPILFKAKVLRDLAKIVQGHVDLLSAVIFGPETVDPATVKRAAEYGLIDKKNPKPGLATLMHLYGSYTASGAADGKMGLDEFQDYVDRNDWPQTEQEKASASFSAQKGAAHMQNTALKLVTQTTQSAQKGEAKLYNALQGVVRDAISAKYGDEDAAARMKEHGEQIGENPELFDDMARETVREVMSDIGHATHEWNRDLQRIAQTENTRAMQEGQKARWQSDAEEDAKAEHKPVREVLVYKIPRPGACKHCIDLHLDGDVPRVYALSQVQGNSNIGVKARDWSFCVGPIHPFCFPASTPVLTSTGHRAIEEIAVGDLVWTHRGRWRRVTRTWERQHAGALVEIDGSLTVTGGHPFLTRRGWLTADRLDARHDLARVGEIGSTNPDHRPSLRSEVGFLFAVLSQLAPPTVPLAAVYFDRHTRVRDGDVDQEAPVLVPGAQSVLESWKQQIEHLALKIGLQHSGLSGHTFAHKLLGLGGSAYSVMGSLDSGGALLGIEPCPLCGGDLASRSRFQPIAFQMGGDGLASPAGALGDRQYVQPFFAEEADHERVIDDRHEFTPAKVRSLKYRNRITVYNLSVHEDESYVAGGFVVHNCGCVLMKVPGFVAMPDYWQSGMAAPEVIGVGGRLVIP